MPNPSHPPSLLFFLPFCSAGKAFAKAPVIAPSQKKFTPADMPALRASGIAAPLLGVIVTGSTPQTMRVAVSGIVKAIG